MVDFAVRLRFIVDYATNQKNEAVKNGLKMFMLFVCVIRG